MAVPVASIHSVSQSGTSSSTKKPAASLVTITSEPLQLAEARAQFAFRHGDQIELQIGVVGALT